MWSHEHFPSIGRPEVREDLFPKAAKYVITTNRRYNQDPHHTIVLYRQEFDLLRADQVVWAPYIWPVEREALIAHRACIMHFDDLYYHPQARCMRQLCIFQSYPDDPLSWTTSKKPSLDEITSALASWWDINNDENSRFRVIGHRVDLTQVAGVVANAYTTWYGTPRMHNPMVTFEESRYEPRGYGDSVVEMLLTRDMNVANLIDGVCNQHPNDEDFCTIRRFANMLREVPERRGEAITAPLRRSRFLVPPVDAQPDDNDDVYIPAPLDRDAHMENDTSSGSGSPASTPRYGCTSASGSTSFYADNSGGYVTPGPYGQFSQYFPTEEVPPYEPTQEVPPQFVRPRRNVQHVPTAVQMCPDCSGLRGRRCHRHI